MAQGGSGKMTYMAFLGYIYGGIIYADSFAFAQAGAAVALALAGYALQRLFCAGKGVYIEIEVSARALDPAYKGRDFQFLSQRGRYGLGRLAQDFSQLEAGQGVISHFGLGGSF